MSLVNILTELKNINIVALPKNINVDMGLKNINILAQACFPLIIPPIVEYILLEDDFFLLQENDFKLAL